MKKRNKKLHSCNKKLPRRRRKPESLLLRTLRAECRFLRAEYQFLKGKCERLELSLLESRPGAPAAYVARSEDAARPPIEDTAAPKRMGFRGLRAEWDKLSLEQQEEHLAKGDWTIDQTKGTN